MTGCYKNLSHSYANFQGVFTNLTSRIQQYLTGMCYLTDTHNLAYFSSLLRYLIEFVEDPSAPNWKGYCLAGLILVTKSVSAFSHRQVHSTYNLKLGSRIKAALTSAIYKKVLFKSLNKVTAVTWYIGNVYVDYGHPLGGDKTCINNICICTPKTISLKYWMFTSIFF